MFSTLYIGHTTEMITWTIEAALITKNSGCQTYFCCLLIGIQVALDFSCMVEIEVDNDYN